MCSSHTPGHISTDCQSDGIPNVHSQESAVCLLAQDELSNGAITKGLYSEIKICGLLQLVKRGSRKSGFC